MGFGMPGFLAAPTLLATRAAHGSVAGLTSATSATTFMVGPPIGNGLYQVTPALPYLLCLALLAALVVFTFTHPGLRTPGQVPDTDRAPG